MLKKNIIINNLNITYYISNSFCPDSPLIFLHGWGSSALLFKNILNNCENFIAIELPGFNGSEITDHPWVLNDYALFLNNFLNKLNIKDPILVGHSFGGSIILKYLLNNFTAKSSVLIDTSGVRKKLLKVIIFKYLAKGVKVFFLLPVMEKYKRIIYKYIGAEDYINSGKLKETFKNIVNEDLTNELKNINSQVFIINGDRDKDTPVNQANILHKNILSSKLFIIKNAGHFSFLDQPEEFNKIFFKILNDS